MPLNEWMSREPERQVVDEGRDVGTLHGSAILCPDLHRQGVADHVLTTITGHLVVDAQLESLQKGASHAH